MIYDLIFTIYEFTIYEFTMYDLCTIFALRADVRLVDDIMQFLILNS